MNQQNDNGSFNVFQARLAEVVTVLYMAIYTGIQGRFLMGEVPGDAHGVLIQSAAAAFYVALLYFTYVRMHNRTNVWGFTLAAALVVYLISTSIQLILHSGDFVVGPVQNTAQIIAGPISDLYLWSLFIYSFLLESSRLWRKRTDRPESASERVVRSSKFRENIWSSLLTAVVVAALPVAVLFSQMGRIPVDVAEVVVSFVQMCDPWIYLLLLGAYVLLYRMIGVPALKFLAAIFGISALKGLIDFGFSQASPEVLMQMGTVGTVVAAASLFLPVLMYYFLLRACSEF